MLCLFYLIFFIVTSVFKKDELALILDLPNANAKEMKVDEEQVFIELNKNRTYNQRY